MWLNIQADNDGSVSKKAPAHNYNKWEGFLGYELYEQNLFFLDSILTTFGLNIHKYDTTYFTLLDWNGVQ